MLNPAGTTPVLVEEGHPPVPGAAIIAEYLDETRGAELGEQRLLPRESGPRVEVRRLMSWFNDKFFAEVSGPLTVGALLQAPHAGEQGGGPPDTDAIRAARHNIRYHLAYIGWLVRTRDWLAGERLSYADLAAAAHLSAVDYLGDVPWNEDEAAKTWYARVKSRPSFRPLLAETLAGHPAVADLRRSRLLNDRAALKAALARAARAARLRRRRRRRGPTPSRTRRRGCARFLAEGAHGDMDWLATTAARRGDPRALWPEARSVIMLGHELRPGRRSAGDPAPARPRRDLGLRAGRRLSRPDQAAAEGAGALARRRRPAAT